MKASKRTSASLVTSPARGGIAVIVLEGPEAEKIVRKIFLPCSNAPFTYERLHLGKIHHQGDVLDEAIINFPTDDMVEINIHGGTFVAGRVLGLLEEKGAQIIPNYAIDPLLMVPNDKFDNPAITMEMLLTLRSAITSLAATAITAQWWDGISALSSCENPSPEALQAAADAFTLMKRLITPAEVVIAGPPNAGKSALNNAIVGRNVSIVTDIPGTTRDWVRTLTNIDGVPIWLTDTAGLWTSAKGIDAEAVERAWAQVESADIVIAVDGPEETSVEENGLIARLYGRPNVIRVFNKCDVADPVGAVDVITSATRLIGIDTLGEAIVRKLGFEGFCPTAPMAFTERQYSLLTLALERLKNGDPIGARNRLDNLLRGPMPTMSGTMER